MALTDSMSAADLAAIVDNDGNGFSGNGAWWILIILMLFGNNGWGNNGFNGYPAVQQGFDQSAIIGAINGVGASVTAGQFDALNRSFDAQTAVTAGLTNLAAQQSQIAAGNQLAISSLAAQLAAEACSDRQAVNEGVRDIIANQTAGFQKILDQMCADKIDAKNEQIQNLQTQINLSNLAASQAAQTLELQNYISRAVNGCGCNSGCGSF